MYGKRCRNVVNAEDGSLSRFPCQFWFWFYVLIICIYYLLGNVLVTLECLSGCLFVSLLATLLEML